jgi:hypothetical protein
MEGGSFFIYTAKKNLLPAAMPFRALILQIINAPGGFLSKSVLMHSNGFLSD